MAIMTKPARAGQAKLNKDQAIHVAWGSGNPSWDVTPVPENVNAAALTSEYGRRRASQVSYCVPDPDGEIETSDGNFTVSETPTNYLFVRCSFAGSDQPTGTIREAAVFVSTVAKSSVPSSQQYLLPADIEDPGHILTIEHFTAIPRENGIRQQFEFVVEF